MIGRKESRLEWKQDILKMLPAGIARAVEGISRETADRLEEIRLRVHQPLAVVARGENMLIGGNGERVDSGLSAYHVTQQDCEEFLTRISQYSVYALEEEIRRGFITIRGGYRVGLCGKAVVEGGRVRMIAPCTFFNLRIARQVFGAANHMMRYILPGGKVASTLLLSPPGMGKTTMLRDAVRQIAGASCLPGGCKVAVVDERSEIAGCRGGIPQNDLGLYTDVLDGCPKAEGIMMMLRAMSPDVLATDEIGRIEDANAIREAVNCGTKVIATIHAGSLEELKRRSGLEEMMEELLFERYILLSKRYGPGTLEMVWDREGTPILERPVRPYGSG
ncbi:MAG: stage III sporulation protein AA [Christensenellales bacterium]|jgi:stage III sporulation protein AA